MQNSPKSSNLGSVMAVSGLVVMVAGLIIMLVLPDIKFAALVVLAAGVALLAVAMVINFRQVRQAVGGRRGRFGLSTVVMACLFVGIIVVVNVFSVGYYMRIDTSSLAQYTLTPQTVNVLQNLKSPVKATFFYDPEDTYGVAAYVESVLTEYKNYNPEQFTVKYIDADMHPDQANAYGITEYQTVVFESGDRRRLVPPTQFLTYDSSGNLGVQIEHPFTSALLEVTGVAQKKVYFLAGHGEANIGSGYSKARDGLLNDLYQVATLSLVTNPQIPDDCAVLIIAAPRTSLSDSEMEAISGYLASGGQAMILTNPGSIPDIEKLVSPWGVDIGEGTIIDPASSVAPDEDTPIIPSARDYFLLPSVYFPGATAIIPQTSPPSDVQMYPMVYTSASSWLDKNFTAGQEPVFDADSEKLEALAVGVMVAQTSSATGKFTRLVVMGDSDFASDDNYDNANNGDLFLNAVSWLAEETSLISIHRNVQSFRRMVVTADETNFIKYSSITLLPVLVLVGAGIVWWRRR